ncbi:hypothetical protein [Brucella pseudogrignonensis]|uniref:Uncharacterized protein n=1 Tax=Brucella pseudogrignonensis TaxID=419475 RepID=A0ABU1MEA7_9HYPH|nr:hypothetical protein [Brucella pseudogrignonensis]MDR6434393.1 hypothetical protein [Brucella pseudogrignonensis]
MYEAGSEKIRRPLRFKRQSTADKDLTQAALLFEALVQTRHGDAWKEGIVSGLSRLPKNGVDALKTALGSDIVESMLKK